MLFWFFEVPLIFSWKPFPLACLFFWAFLFKDFRTAFELFPRFFQSLFFFVIPYTQLCFIEFLWLRLFLRCVFLLLGSSFRFTGRSVSEFLTINFYNLFTPTCTSSFYPDDHLGRFMGFSHFVELKSARFVERKRKQRRNL